jgi:hypothetical protein
MTLTDPDGLVAAGGTLAELGGVLARISGILDVDPDIAAMPAGVQLWTRTVGKIAEETGEAAEALIALQGGNPRKNRIRYPWWRLIRRYRAWREGWNFTEAERRNALIKELVDIIVTAAAGLEHVTGNQGHSLDLVAERAPLLEARLHRSVVLRLEANGDYTTVVP